jgi:hypothetical protein
MAPGRVSPIPPGRVQEVPPPLYRPVSPGRLNAVPPPPGLQAMAPAAPHPGAFGQARPAADVNPAQKLKPPKNVKPIAGARPYFHGGVSPIAAALPMAALKLKKAKKPKRKTEYSSETETETETDEEVSKRYCTQCAWHLSHAFPFRAPNPYGDSEAEKYFSRPPVCFAHFSSDTIVKDDKLVKLKDLWKDMMARQPCGLCDGARKSARPRETPWDGAPNEGQRYFSPRLFCAGHSGRRDVVAEDGELVSVRTYWKKMRNEKEKEACPMCEGQKRLARPRREKSQWGFNEGDKWFEPSPLCGLHYGSKVIVDEGKVITIEEYWKKTVEALKKTEEEREGKMEKAKTEAEAKSKANKEAEEEQRRLKAWKEYYKTKEEWDKYEEYKKRLEEYEHKRLLDEEEAKRKQAWDDYYKKQAEEDEEKQKKAWDDYYKKEAEDKEGKMKAEEEEEKERRKAWDDYYDKKAAWDEYEKQIQEESQTWEEQKLLEDLVSTDESDVEAQHGGHHHRRSTWVTSEGTDDTDDSRRGKQYEETAQALGAPDLLSPYHPTHNHNGPRSRTRSTSNPYHDTKEAAGEGRRRPRSMDPPRPRESNQRDQSPLPYPPEWTEDQVQR